MILGFQLRTPAIIRPYAATGFGVFRPPTPATLTYQTTTRNGTNLAAYSFTTQAIGTAAADRRVFMAIHYGAGSGGFTISSATIAGVTGTQHVFTSVGTTNFRATAIYSALVPTGTTGTMAVNFSGSVGRCGIGIWSAYGLKNTTPFATTSSNVQPLSLSLARPPNGIAIGAWTSVTTTTGNTTWTGLTERYDVVDETTTMETGADASGLYNGSSSFAITASVTNSSGTASTSCALTWV